MVSYFNLMIAASSRRRRNRQQKPRTAWHHRAAVARASISHEVVPCETFGGGRLRASR